MSAQTKAPAVPATAAPSSETLRALQVAHEALTDCVKHLLARGPAPCPSFMATATGAVARALVNAKAARTPRDAEIENAFAACRSIRFAVKNASRYGGEFSLNDILAADRLAREALGDGAADKVPAKVPAITKRSLAAHKANWTRAKKGGRT